MPKVLRPRQEFPTPLFKVTVPLLVAAAIGVGVWLAVGPGGGGRAGDPPLLVPWHQIGDISLGEPKAQFLREYGRYRIPGPWFRLHGTKVSVDFYRGRISLIAFSTPYYRTRSGFGVGSRMPSGRRTWHGFVYGPYLKENRCSCWVKVGTGAKSLAISTDNFLKPWFIIDVRRGRVTDFYFDARYID